MFAFTSPRGLSSRVDNVAGSVGGRGFCWVGYCVKEKKQRRNEASKKKTKYGSPKRAKRQLGLHLIVAVVLIATCSRDKMPQPAKTQSCLRSYNAAIVCVYVFSGYSAWSVANGWHILMCSWNWVGTEGGYSMWSNGGGWCTVSITWIGYKYSECILSVCSRIQQQGIVYAPDTHMVFMPL